MRGTHIMTDRGARAIESLAIGDRVLSWKTGEYRPIRWIGRRTVRTDDLLTEEGRRVHLPVLIQRNAFAENAPSRDLYLSPAHGLLVKDYGISVRHLINGTTVRQVDDIQTIEYFHIELDSHDGVYAENMVAETYFESDNRHAYDNAGEYERLYPGDDPRVQEPCVRIDVPVTFVAGVRALLNKRAAQLAADAAV
ncbi:Hint domain-containing protein [Azospirillum oleiclasticum]|uniref:Hint domain-containing protein n=1 Tax=Azospirillum oleiclasticum TaxID=2735135 RepID=UPI0024844CE2|nr:Hint domain-containing protein [Azospirillum oleiclasticum]